MTTLFRWREDAEGNAAVWASWQNLNEDQRGKVKGWPYHGRAWLHWGHGCREHAGFSWNFWSRSCGVSLSCDRGGGDDTWSSSVAFPPVAFYFSLCLEPRRWLSKLADRLSKAVADVTSYGGMDVSVRVFDWALWWEFAVDSMGSPGGDRARPRWRDGNWRPLGFRMRQGEPEVVEEREVVVPMPEGAYLGRAKLERSRWGFTKLPRFFDKTGYHVEIEMLADNQVPFPGKGENSYDCGEDAAFAMTFTTTSFPEAVGKFVGQVLRDRERYGGRKWRPAPKEIAA